MVYEFLKNKGVLDNPVNKELIDVGSGDGSSGAEFESHGWEVTYIEKKNGVDATTYDFPIDTYGLAVARNSLPFMEDKQLDVISKIYSTLKQGGYFYGTVFGIEDPWAKEGIITPVDFDIFKSDLKNLGFEILWESVEKGTGKTMKGDFKNWHIFKFLCKNSIEEKPSIFDAVKKLNLPLGKYAVVGGGVLAAHGLRQYNDVDFVVTPELYEELKQDGWENAPDKEGVVQKDNCEADFTFDFSGYETDIPRLIREAD
ncbi:MAG: hypothetical protein V4438_03915, partial [Patescibacteria group bacterium]